MIRRNWHLPITLFSIAIFIETLFIALPSFANNTESDSIVLNQTLANVTFYPPKDGQPDSTVSGGSRPIKLCSNDNSTPELSVTALIPSIKTNLTVATHPTFFVYVPDTSAQKLVFSLRDESEDYDYIKTIPLPNNPGIVKVKLPLDAPPIETDKNYKLSFTIQCGNQVNPNDFSWQGNIRRVDFNSDLINQQNKESLMRQASIYGRNGIWLDMLETMLQLKQTYPSDIAIKDNWVALLQSVGLDAIANQSISQ